MAGQRTTVTKSLARFYKTVSIEAQGNEFFVLLDGRRARLGGILLASPTQSLSEAIAQEWNDQGEELDPKSMVLSQMLAHALASDDARVHAMEEITQYLGTDLVCYRADRDDALAREQETVWGPFVRWFEKEFGARLNITAGVISIDQPEAAPDSVCAKLAPINEASVFGIYRAVKITGSAVLGLAAWSGQFDGDAVFTASRVDEHYQARKWGADAEAQAREEVMLNEFRDVVRFMALAR